MSRSNPLILLTGLALLALAAPAEARTRKAAPPPKLDAATINAAEPGDQTASLPKPGAAPSPLLVRAQVLLDRARFSPGAIDGRRGSSSDAALAAFAAAQGQPSEPRLTPEVWAKLSAVSTEPAVVEYAITEADVKGPFTAKIPAKMEEQADLDRLGYRDVAEMLAERFHLSESLLKALNPGKILDQAGTTILVPGVAPMPDGKGKAKSDARVTRIEIDKAQKRLSAFDNGGALIAVYPASIGSTEKPAPSGTLKVKSVAIEPTYTYNPKYAFKGVKATKTFSIKPGPNNPVGIAWIDLSKESYGIHGTAEPERVGKTASHGCVRLTNWDVRALAAMVEPGASVVFKE